MGTYPCLPSDVHLHFETSQENAAVHGGPGALGHAQGARAAAIASWQDSDVQSVEGHVICTTSKGPELPICLTRHPSTP